MNEYGLENIDEKDQNLESRLKVGHISDVIHVTDFGTVIKNYHSSYQQEERYDKFIKGIMKGIEAGTSLVKYDQETNSFYLIEKSDEGETRAHPIEINESVMEDYANGKYTKTTLQFNGLVLRSEEKVKLEEQALAKQEKTNAVIAKGDRSINELSPLDARMYLDHLKKTDKKNYKSIAKDTATITGLAGFPIAAGVATGAILFVPGAPIIYSILIGVLGSTIGSLVEGMVRMFVSDTPTMDLLPINRIKQLAKEIKEKAGEIGVNKTKERELKKIKYVDQIVMPESVTIVENNSVEPLELKDSILKQIDMMINQVSTLNPKDRDAMITELKAMKQSYIDRSTNAINRDGVAMDLNADGLAKIRTDICTSLGKMQFRVDKIKLKDAKTKLLTKESELLDAKMDHIEKVSKSSRRIAHNNQHPLPQPVIEDYSTVQEEAPTKRSAK
ncbi:MAG: hypothetical protein IKQ35_04090 [Bacilli bacterium]|nr:hypothetical protein [Bacilli bacterium]